MRLVAAHQRRGIGIRRYRRRREQRPLPETLSPQHTCSPELTLLLTCTLENADL